LSGCAALPLGVSKAEWDAMSPQKQVEYRRLQSMADNQKRQDAARDRSYVEQSIKQAETPSGLSAVDHAQAR
jgi:hypothetical protein